MKNSDSDELSFLFSRKKIKMDRLTSLRALKTVKGPVYI